MCARTFRLPCRRLCLASRPGNEEEGTSERIVPTLGERSTGFGGRRNHGRAVQYLYLRSMMAISVVINSDLWYVNEIKSLSITDTRVAFGVKQFAVEEYKTSLMMTFWEPEFYGVVFVGGGGMLCPSVTLLHLR